ncbi:hypothetical protein M440DRAFT_1030481 [Trichoderma longibrachiatum ATCC 18648]|uniref:Uncharacterized protein n=1 Tax=Trichoderma longibrachiatum ATCC 18648 TaxID=983965 RepID=A0A2T4BZ66_TRILO|nr:hypothetical protein M440DRAFT_1030481 [Trichoderma longibrachiatum ATCC 18648]
MPWRESALESSSTGWMERCGGGHVLLEIRGDAGGAKTPGIRRTGQPLAGPLALEPFYCRRLPDSRESLLGPLLGSITSWAVYRLFDGLGRGDLEVCD